MIAFNASDVPGVAASADALLALLKVMVDPKAAAGYLAELKAALDDGGRNAGRQEIGSRLADLDMREQAMADRAAVRQAELEAREAQIAERERALEQAEQALAEKLSRLRQLAAPATACRVGPF
jgi:hypothetical protein